MADFKWWKMNARLNERWTLNAGVDEHGRFPHVRYVLDSDGNRAVAKRPRRSSMSALSRFYDEVNGLETLNGMAGILPLLDRDEGSEPRWFVMPEATPLSKQIKYMTTVEFVSMFADLADILDQLHRKLGRDGGHRDIKPDNLFWYDGKAVFGDFGLAAWTERADVTAHGERVGALAYQAPEALNSTKDIDWAAADVYSLVKTMWSLADHQAACRDSTVASSAAPVVDPILLYPPQGLMNATIDLNHSFRRFFGPGGRQLDQLVEDSTSNHPAMRPTAAELRDGLRAWVRLNGSVVTSDRRNTDINWESLLRSHALHNDTTDKFLKTLRSEIHRVFNNLDFDVTVKVEPDADWSPTSVKLLDSHGRKILTDWNCEEDGPEPEPWDGALVLALQSADGDAQILIGGVIESVSGRRTLDVVAEVQHRGGDGEWTLTKNIDKNDLRAGSPVATEVIRNLLDTLKAEARIAEGVRWTGTRII